MASPDEPFVVTSKRTRTRVATVCVRHVVALGLFALITVVSGVCAVGPALRARPKWTRATTRISCSRVRHANAADVRRGASRRRRLLGRSCWSGHRGVEQQALPARPGAIAEPHPGLDYLSCSRAAHC